MEAVQQGFEFSGRPGQARLSAYETWIREMVDEAAAEALQDPFDIKRGEPLVTERQALSNFFPRLFRGVPLRAIGRTLIAEIGNAEDKYAPDIVVRLADAPKDEVVAIVDVERKTTDRLFTHHLPLNVPWLRMAAHRGEVPYFWPDGSERLCGKIRYFRQFPDISFFLAVAPGGAMGMLTTGRQIIERQPEWIRATGPFKDGRIKVVRVPRTLTIIGCSGKHDIENAVLNAPGVQAEILRG